MSKKDRSERLPSRSQKKRRSNALQELGERLVGLSGAEWEELDLPLDLRAALTDAARLSARGGKRGGNAMRRQMQYVGKLMRGLDPEPIMAYFDVADRARAREGTAFHRLETWRDRLLTGDETALKEIAAVYGRVDITGLREMANQARAEAEQGRPPKSARRLFRYLRSLQEVAEDAEWDDV